MEKEFRIRIEMKQIGARQEAGLIGGLGVCGRELCCANYITNFQSISTSAARSQELSLNPQKLAGQCGKLKCCLNYEVANYLDAQTRIPKVSEPLEFMDGPAYLVKTDILQETMYFSYEKGSLTNLYALHASEVREIMMMNRNGEKPESLKADITPEGPQFISAVGDDFEGVAGPLCLPRDARYRIQGTYSLSPDSRRTGRTVEIATRTDDAG